jgi:hypothetical protein
MGQIELEGVVSPRGRKPSRFTICHRRNLDNLNKVLPLRNPTVTYKKLTKALSYIKLPRKKTKGEKILRRLGLQPVEVHL